MATYTKHTSQFTADKFTPTQWDTAEDKAKFAQRFVKFVISNFEEHRFTEALYRRLSMTFGHIAHNNKTGFFDEFFRTTKDKLRFLRICLFHVPAGSPKFTYCDVEHALQTWLVENKIIQKYAELLHEETEKAEKAILAKLQEKYGTGPASDPMPRGWAPNLKE